MDVIIVLSILLIAATLWLLACKSENWLCNARDRIKNFLQNLAIAGWLRKRFSREERFGLSLTIGLIIALIAGWIFGELADEVVEAGLLNDLDLAFGESLLGVSTPTGSRLFYIITLFGSTVTLLPGSLFVIVWLWVQRRYRDVLVFIVAVGGGILINLLLKMLFGRPRPDFLDAYYMEIGFSFPSGHAMMSVLFYGMAAYLIALTIKNWRWRMALLTTALSIAILIGFSRIYLGVHFFSDVIGGWTAGATWLSAVITGKEVAGW